MRANAAGQSWQPVPAECFEAIAEAQRAHEQTDGLFDPRVLGRLVELGYDHSLPFGTEQVQLDRPPEPSPAPRPVPRPWRPGLDRARGQVRIGPDPLDLGGIGKGLAVRWASAILAPAGSAHLINAGGDCYLAGPGPLGEGWPVGVEDPDGEPGSDPVAVLRLRDQACATSSLRLRTWQRGEATVHHLIDPRTGASAVSGLRSVTVVGPDPALAEVWSKTLLITGAQAIAERAGREGLAALWVQDDGGLGTSQAIRDQVIWRAR